MKTFILAFGVVLGSALGVAAAPPMAAMPGLGPAGAHSHMVMTAPGPPRPGDRARAAALVRAARAAMRPFRDYRAALAAGYREFAPNMPNQEKHFVNPRYALRARRRFDPAHPPALLYDRTPGGGWKLAGVMYTAPRSFTLAQLNRRVPLSVARWHRHVNYCLPPATPAAPGQAAARFLHFFRIANPAACRRAGGRWRAQLFGWMVHVYPYAANPWHLAPDMSMP